jgi:hypothetical protein
VGIGISTCRLQVIVALHVVLDIVADLGQLFESGMGKIARKPVIEVQTVPVRDSNGYTRLYIEIGLSAACVTSCAEI